jgi:UDP-glucuronate 4-epimerase
LISILITGCAGFIGSHLSELLLSEGYNVIGVDNFDAFYSKSIKLKNLEKSLSNNSFKFYEIDISNKLELQKIENEIDVVIHIAAKAGVLPSINDVSGYISTNIDGTNNVLEFMKERQIKKLLFASSSSVYGNNKAIPFNESHAVEHLISPYAFTKRSCELLNHVYHHLYAIDIINLRFFTVYGPRQRPDLAIHKFVKLIDEKQPINMYGDGSTARDYTFVEDTVAGVYSALKYILANNNVFEIVNLGNNEPVKLKDLIDTIYEIMNVAPNLNRMPMQAGDVDITFADISKAEKLFGYHPKVKIKHGLQKFINWYYVQKK